MTHLDVISDFVRSRAARSSPYILGVTGAVAAGKSTFSAELARLLAKPPGSLTVEVVGTDGFLMDNAALEARDLLNRKGFPESYDSQAMRRTLSEIRAGPAEFPGYSHALYDIDPTLTRLISPPDVLILEGLGLHEGAAAAGLDALVYLDADELLIEAWFTDRFLEFFRAAETDPTSFYARFRHLDEAGARGVAGLVWRAINLPNLREHISGAKERADIVVTKGAGHEILAVVERGAAPA